MDFINQRFRGYVERVLDINGKNVFVSMRFKASFVNRAVWKNECDVMSGASGKFVYIVDLLERVDVALGAQDASVFFKKGKRARQIDGFEKHIFL